MIDWSKSAKEILKDNVGHTFTEEEFARLQKMDAEERKASVEVEEDEQALADRIYMMGNCGLYTSKDALKEREELIKEIESLLMARTSDMDEEEEEMYSALDSLLDILKM